MERKGLVEEDAFNRRHWGRCIRYSTALSREDGGKEGNLLPLVLM